MNIKLNLLLATAFLGSSLGLPGALDAQQPPDLPSIEEILQARHDAVSPALDAELRKTEVASPGQFRSLFLDRLSFTASYGRGLTVNDELDGSTVVESLSNLHSSGTWLVTYKVPLSTLFDNAAKRSTARLDREIAQFKHRQTLLEEEVKLRQIHNQFLYAKAEYERSFGPLTTGTRADGLKSGYEMRALALELLLLADRRDSEAFVEWSSFLSGNSQKATQLAQN